MTRAQTRAVTLEDQLQDLASLKCVIVRITDGVAVLPEGIIELLSHPYLGKTAMVRWYRHPWKEANLLNWHQVIGKIMVNGRHMDILYEPEVHPKERGR